MRGAAQEKKEKTRIAPSSLVSRTATCSGATPAASRLGGGREKGGGGGRGVVSFEKNRDPQHKGARPRRLPPSLPSPPPPAALATRCRSRARVAAGRGRGRQDPRRQVPSRPHRRARRRFWCRPPSPLTDSRRRRGSPGGRPTRRRRRRPRRRSRGRTRRALAGRKGGREKRGKGWGRGDGCWASTWRRCCLFGGVDGGDEKEGVGDEK